MNLRLKKLLLPLSLLVGFFVFIPLVSTFAQQSPNYDVTVSPVFFDLSANPGSTVSDKIRVRNNTSNPLSIKLEVKKLTGDDNGDLVIKDENDDNSLSWIKFKEKTFVAKPLEWTDVPFSIEVPKTAAYGYYFAVNFTQENNDKLNQVGTKITGAAAVPILLNVRKNGAKFEGNVKSFTATKGFYEYLPVSLTTVFQNTGNVHVKPRGNIFIRDFLGRQVAILDVNSTQGTVLPNTKKAFESIWNDSFITEEPKMEDGQIKLDKNGKPQTTLKIKFDKILDLRIGKYTATSLLVISTNTRDIPFQSETSFFVFPWKVVLIAIAFVVFAFLGFANTIKNLIKRIIKIFKK